MKIDYKEKSVKLNWAEFGLLSKEAQKRLLNYSMSTREMFELSKKGEDLQKIIDSRKGLRKMAYNGKGLCVYFADENFPLNEQDFINLVPGEIFALEANLDFYLAAHNLPEIPDDDIENE